MKGSTLDELELRRISHGVARARHRLRLSHRDVEAASGVSYSAVSRIETGDRFPTSRSLLALASALDIDITFRHDGRVSVRFIEHVHDPKEVSA